MDVLWPNERPAAPEQNVATLVSRLRAVLGADLIQGGRTGYRLAAGPGIVVDLDTAARFCDQAEGKLATAAAVALAAAERAHELLSAGTAIGDEPYADWADPAREQVRELLRRVRLAAAEAALATGRPAAGRGLRGSGHGRRPARRGGSPLVHVGLGRGGRAGEGPRGLRGAPAAARPRARRRPGAADAGAAPGDPARAGRRPRHHPQRRPGCRRGTPGGPAPGGSTAPAGAGRRDGGAAGGVEHGRRGQPGLVTIVGEAGIGKTALAEFLAAEAAENGGTVLRTRCYETERSLFLQPIVEAIAPVVASASASMLRQLLGEHATAAAGLLPEVAAILGPPPPGRGSMEMERRRAFEAVRAFLRGLAEHNPVLVLVDDLQYAGQSTVELIHFLGRQPPAPGCSWWPPSARRTTRRSAPRSRRWPAGSRWGRSARMRSASSPARPGKVSWPTASWSRPAATPCSSSRCCARLTSGDAGVPESLRTAVQARVRRAGPPVEALLRAAAVLGATVDPLTLGVMLDLVPATALELCEAALAARLLVVSGRDYEFANDLIREVLYASTPEPTRLAHHRRAADLLTGQPESLARHAAAAGDWLRAARAWLRAGEDAMGRFAASDAAALATQALEAGGRVADAEVSARALVLRGRASRGRRCPRRRARRPDPGRRRRPRGRRPPTGDARPARARRRRPGLAGPARQLLRGQPRERPADRSNRSGTGPAKRTCSPASPSSRRNRLRLDAALDYGLRAVAAGRAAADDQALAAGLDGLKFAYLSVGDTGALADVLAELGPAAAAPG